MYKLEIQLDEEKIRKEGKYTVEELYGEIEGLCKKYNLWKEKEPIGDEPRVYITVEDENEMAQFGCVFLRLRKKAILIERLKLWNEFQYDEMKQTWFCENNLNYIKAEGYQYGRE